MRIPEQIPELGFYYHYKHDPDGPIEDYAYELVGVGVHTEEDCRDEDANMAVYRPLYRSVVYEEGKLVWLRPLSMWKETVEKGGKTMLRFRKIEDPELISRLAEIRNEMY